MLDRFYNARDISVLNGKTITSISGLYAGSNEIVISCADDTKYKMYHQQDFAEDVSVNYVSCTGKYCTTYDSHAPEQISGVIYETPILSTSCSVHADHTEGYASTFVADEFFSIAQSVTTFTIETKMGKLLIVWKGVAHDLESSTEVDFIEITGCHAEEEEYMGGATVVDGAGRVTIPKRYRDKADIKPGDSLVWWIDGWGIRCEPLKGSPIDDAHPQSANW